MSSVIRDLLNLFPDDSEDFGHKACNLGLLARRGICIPKGFCVSARARRLSTATRMEIKKHLDELMMPICVRSSRSCEDSGQYSFAGVLESSLNLWNGADILKAVEKCFQSTRSERAQAYLRDSGQRRIRVGVIIQEMVEVDYSAIVFTADPYDQKHIYIEAVPGPCVDLSAGRITPSSFFVDKNTRHIRRSENRHAIRKNLVRELALVAAQIETIFGIPQDIECGAKRTRTVIFQSRPITA